MRNYLTFDNKDSLDFGVYINGQGTFRAPARSYNVLNIPGRNGDLLGFGSKLENVEITYRAFIYTNFDANIAALRSFLLSHVGYFKLTDSYHPDEYRLAYYKGPFVPDVVANNGAGSFDLTFVCKPQRFLNSGEEVTTLTPAGAEQHTYQGEIVNFSTLAGDKITSALADFHPIQDLHGYASPWPAGGGKNKLDSGFCLNRTARGLKTVVNADGSITLTGTSDGTARYWNSSDTLGLVLSAGTYTLSPSNLRLEKSGGGTVTGTFTLSEETEFNNVYWTGFTNGEVVNTVVYPQLESGSTVTSWEPYENICPISGRTGLSVYVSPTTAQADATTYSVDWTSEAGTVYGGTLDVVTGLLTVDWAMVDMGTLNWSPAVSDRNTRFRAPVVGIKRISLGTELGHILCSNYEPKTANQTYVGKIGISQQQNNNDVYIYDPQKEELSAADFKTAMSGVQLCYELATPITYQLTPQEIEALADNYMWSDVGQVTVTVTDAMTIENPTLFDAKPLLRVYGAGTLTLGGQTITISTADVYTDIDCEMMDCFKDTVSKNGNVSFSGYDFPVIPPGRNVITMDGVTQVDITPRWWAA